MASPGIPTRTSRSPARRAAPSGVLRLAARLRARRRRRQRRGARGCAARRHRSRAASSCTATARPMPTSTAALAARLRPRRARRASTRARASLPRPSAMGAASPSRCASRPASWPAGHEKIATAHAGLEVRPRARRRRAGVHRGAGGSTARLARPARAPRLAGGRSRRARRRRSLVPRDSATSTRSSRA